MKKLIYSISFMLCLLYYSCGSDNCEGVTCGEGMCDDGTCICTTGYEGESCETLVNEKYFGVYAPGVVDCGGNNGTTINTITITAHSNGNPSEISMRVAASNIDDTVDGSIVDDELTVSGDWGGFDLNITGTFTDNMTLDSRINASGLLCEIIFDKQ